MSEKPDGGLSPIVGILLMLVVTIVIAIVVSGFVYSTIPFKMTVINLNTNQIAVQVVYSSNNSPISDVPIGTFSHDTHFIIDGPAYSNESGQVLLDIPDGNDYFDVVGTFNNITITRTIDNRFITAKISDRLGPFGIEIVAIVVPLLVLLVVAAYIKRDRLKTILKKIWDRFANFFQSG